MTTDVERICDLLDRIVIGRKAISAAIGEPVRRVPELAEEGLLVAWKAGSWQARYSECMRYVKAKERRLRACQGDNSA